MDKQLDAFDAGLLNDFGGGNVDWWMDYIRSLLGQAHDHYQAQITALTQDRAAVLPEGWEIVTHNYGKDFIGIVHKESGLHGGVHEPAPDAVYRERAFWKFLHELRALQTPPATQAEPKVYERKNHPAFGTYMAHDTRNPAVADRRMRETRRYDMTSLAFLEGSRRKGQRRDNTRRAGGRARWVEDSGMRNSDGSVPDGAIYAAHNKQYRGIEELLATGGKYITPPQPAAEVSLVAEFRKACNFHEQVKWYTVTSEYFEVALNLIDDKLRELDKRGVKP